jgi:predicted metal-dependent peptidase
MSMMTTASIPDKMRAALRKLGLMDNPAILIGLARVTIKESKCGTACIDARGRMQIDSKFGATQRPGQLVYIGLHEMLHLISLHFERRGVRDPLLWNIAGDLIINGIIEEMRAALPEADRHMIERPTMADGGKILIPTSDQAKKTVEALYDEVEKDADKWRKKCGGGFGQGCGAIDPGDMTEAEKQNAASQWRQAAEAAAQVGRGTVSGDAIARLSKPPPPKTPWDQLLRRVGQIATSACGVDDKSFRRISRRSPPKVLMPSDVSHGPNVVAMVDSSGSVNDESLGVAVSHVQKIAKVNAARVFLIIHDHDVKFAGWLKSNEKFDSIAAKVTGRGGTSFEAAWKRIEEERCRFHAMVQLTDGECPWPKERPNNVGVLFVALVGSCHRGSDMPATARVFDVEIGK